MMRLIAAACFCMIFISAAQADDTTPPAAAAPCRLLMAASYDMIVMPDGEVAVAAQLGGRPVRLLVDTGDIFTVVKTSVADELELRPQFSGVMQVLLGGIPSYQEITAPSIQLGNLHASDFRVMLIKQDALEDGVDGLLGANIFNNYDIEFDFAHAKFNLFSQDHCKDPGVYWTRDPAAAIPITIDRAWHINAPVTVDGTQLTAVIDSGADRSSMSLEFAEKKFGFAANDPRLKVIGKRSINGTAMTPIYSFPFSAINLEGLQINHPDIDLIPEGVYGTRNPELLLGINVLRHLRVYIAYKDQVMYATDAEAK